MCETPTIEHSPATASSVRPRSCQSFFLVVAWLALLAGAPAAMAGFDASERPADVEMGPLADLDALWRSPRVPNEVDVSLLERANSAFKTDEPQCAFTLWETNGQDSWSQRRFDPRAAPQWRVVATSDPQPSQVDREEEGNQEDDQDPAYPRHPTIGPLDDLDRYFEGSAGTLSILLEAEDLTVFGLVPDFDGEKVPKWAKKTRPRITIVVDHERPMISAVDSAITKPYSPKFGLRFTHWRLTEINEYNEATDSIVVAHRSLGMRGTVFRLAKFQNTMMQWYDDFAC